MIKLERGAAPSELTEEVKQELTDKYKDAKDNEVWNSPKIKKPLKEALLKMSYNKCVYCECILGIESKDATIDHFKPKSKNEDIVIEWENLVPSCLRCNRSKNANVDTIINPFVDNPKDYLSIQVETCKIRSKDKSILGQSTIDVLDINNLERVRSARFSIVSTVRDKIEELLEDIEECIENKKKITPKYITRFSRILEFGMKENPYSAMISTSILVDDNFKRIVEILKVNKYWNFGLKQQVDLLELNSMSIWKKRAKDK